MREPAVNQSLRIPLNMGRETPAQAILQPVEPTAPAVSALSAPMETRIISRHRRDPSAFSSSDAIAGSFNDGDRPGMSSEVNPASAETGSTRHPGTGTDSAAPTRRTFPGASGEAFIFETLLRLRTIEGVRGQSWQPLRCIFRSVSIAITHCFSLGNRLEMAAATSRIPASIAPKTGVGLGCGFKKCTKWNYSK